ncbi:hypothetical protein QYF36_004042 [Acer negundo]|nr:hypothetical protein QYF36_004042 [Acer negundo]
MAVFLMVVSHNLQNRVVRNRFKHSTQTVHKCFHEVLAAMMKFSKEMITPPSFNGNCNSISNHRLRQSFKFSQYEDEELIMENDNANHQLPNTNNSYETSNAIFMQRFRDHIAEKLLKASV